MATRSEIANPSQTTHVPPVSKRRYVLFHRLWRARISYILLAVFFVPFVIFQLYPVASSAYLSLTDYSGSPNKEVTFLGIENFRELLGIQLVSLPRLLDDQSGQEMFQCGRKKFPSAEVVAQEAEGVTCTPAFENPRDYVSEGYKEWRTLFETNDSRTIIAATDTRFWTAVWNTTIFVTLSVVVRLVVGLLLALMLQKQSRLNMLLRTVFFLPTVTAGVAVTVVWGWIFRGQDYGLVNSVMMQSGITKDVIAFLNDPNWMLPILIWLAIWGGVGYTMILYLAGLQSISSEFYEAATVDGASTFDKFRFITLPLLRPTSLFLVITGIIGSFQVFDTVYILFSGVAGQGVGGTLDGALTIVGYLYERGFRLFQLGYASAIAWVLFIIIFILTLINLRAGRGNEAYVS